MKKLIGIILSTLLLIGVVGCSSSSSSSNNTGAEGENSGGEAKKPKKIVLDYAYYSPTSLVLKEFGWVEEAFAQDDIKIEFVLSQGSNKALEFLNSGSADFGSTAGAAALMAKAKGAPIESVYIYSKPEWTALVTGKDSAIKSVEELKGKKVAATVGTDPYIFLLRALDEVGLTAKDIEIVALQHSDGASALATNQVDAWAGLDPHMARVEVETKANLFYRNVDFNTYGVLNVRSEFAKEYPEQVKKVIEVYEKARKWAIENPDELAEILVKHAQISPEVAKKQLERNDFSEPVPGEKQIEALNAAGIVLQKGDIIDKNTDVSTLVNELINPEFAKEVIK
ncbi:aliphatic sulfonate ABC transporter substrate-binding protein [Schinkia azotoformans]|uniref:Putative aliphatic sulfonates-binding protein n=1 Tax=Schinkia azotoformans LMG 9581 TaxID=1131731 RepID=K6E3V8_SCHAZ|nr:aliphatic sulfonate ABC transporter substrate-binding protein [Schinkia azotoformans]EKN67921.1 aliphatic sulfonates family ABC transporter periplasmic ligand-binding protein [Schinkia azotoformans LMG 9581]MEC1637060.1 aliphatic sulfonate ABC transporter substrate-binding protein [Schinkia azotoformans]MEC1719914.1 aliphatic sulfonate ABC transporter substrate-binding protein [Schinkia azotoformans]MEC1945495.1 aliphatic sulfonate ABC transporter substrate-binding protein [Schinkia azotofor